MDGKMLFRLGAVVFVAVAFTATVIELTRKPEEPPLYRALPSASDLSSDPLKTILRQCRDMGEPATRDAACLKAWADSRDRFLNPGKAASAPDTPGAQTTAPTTLFPDDKTSAAGPTGPATEPVEGR